MNTIWMGFYHGAAMFWETLWALVLGFGISAALQVFVSKEQMTRALGRAGLREMLLATGFGAASSSCSYAAASIGRSAFQKGAALVPALADRKSTRLNSSHTVISYAVFCLKKKNKKREQRESAY